MCVMAGRSEYIPVKDQSAHAVVWRNHSNRWRDFRFQRWVRRPGCNPGQPSLRARHSHCVEWRDVPGRKPSGRRRCARHGHAEHRVRAGRCRRCAWQCKDASWPQDLQHGHSQLQPHRIKLCTEVSFEQRRATSTGAVNQISGTTILTLDGNFNGSVTITGGVLQFGNDTAAGSLAADTIVTGTDATHKGYAGLWPLRYLYL